MITRWYNQDSIEAVLASTYAGGKGYWFELFFGWRQTNCKGDSKFVFSRKDWERIDTEIEYYKKFVA